MTKLIILLLGPLLKNAGFTNDLVQKTVRENRTSAKFIARGLYTVSVTTELLTNNEERRSQTPLM